MSVTPVPSLPTHAHVVDLHSQRWRARESGEQREASHAYMHVTQKGASKCFTVGRG